MSNYRSLGVVLSGLLLFSACAKPIDGDALSGKVRVDGSSTVFPISEAVGEDYSAREPGVRVTIATSGTGGGFKKFCLGETDINDASRSIKDSEAESCAKNKVGYIEIPVAYDGLSVVVNSKNDFCDDITVAELKKLWDAGSVVKLWSEVRDGWPASPIKLYGPGTDSGTFDYFTEAINGKSQRCRSDFTASEDDNVLVRGISGDINALGFFGYAYYVENKDKLKVVPVKLDANSPAIAPSAKTINNGTYRPLSRPIFIYVSAKAAERPEVDSFVRFYIENAGPLGAEVGYVALPDAIYALAMSRFANRQTGSMFDGGKKGGLAALMSSTNN